MIFSCLNIIPSLLYHIKNKNQYIKEKPQAKNTCGISIGLCAEKVSNIIERLNSTLGKNKIVIAEDLTEIHKSDNAQNSKNGNNSQLNDQKCASKTANSPVFCKNGEKNYCGKSNVGQIKKNKQTHVSECGKAAGGIRLHSYSPFGSSAIILAQRHANVNIFLDGNDF